MDASTSLLARLRRWLGASVEVPLVCEIAADYVAALRHRQGGVEAWAVRALPAGAVCPAPLAENITDGTVVQQALEHVLGSVAGERQRCALLVPDLLARVVVVEFDQLPDSAEEAEALLRWRLSKDLPFDVSQAVLSYQTQSARTAGQEALVAVCLRTLLRQYEECVESLGLQPGWVTLSTLAASGWLRSSDTAPRLLLKRDHTSLGMAVVHGAAVRLFRSVPTPAGSGSLNDEALFEKVYPGVIYFQDQWGQPVSEVVVAGGGGPLPALAQRLEREVGCAVTELNPTASELPPSPASEAAPDHRLTPVLGWVRGEAG